MSEETMSDELFVDPRLRPLVQQRGNLNCGGAQYVLVRYGNFYRLVVALAQGHLSVCIGLDADPLVHVPTIRGIMAGFGLA